MSGGVRDCNRSGLGTEEPREVEKRFVCVYGGGSFEPLARGGGVQGKGLS